MVFQLRAAFRKAPVVKVTCPTGAQRNSALVRGRNSPSKRLEVLLNIFPQAEARLAHVLQVKDFSAEPFSYL
jgi:hypothetical protein